MTDTETNIYSAVKGLVDAIEAESNEAAKQHAVTLLAGFLANQAAQTKALERIADALEARGL